MPSDRDPAVDSATLQRRLLLSASVYSVCLLFALGASLWFHDRTSAVAHVTTGGHGHPGENVWLKIATVLLLTGLWFTTFRTARAYRDSRDPIRPKSVGSTKGGSFTLHWDGLKVVLIVAACVPSTLFVNAMLAAYEPAVLLMALLAIVIAAEHYDGLQQTEKKLDATADLLLNKALELSSSMERVLDADGLSSWRDEVYHLYSGATRRVDAVIRFFDIDAEWWQCGNSGKPWEEYQKIVKSRPASLLTALYACQASVQFVSDMPLPNVDITAQSPHQKGLFFRNLLGLAWQLVIFDLVWEKRRADAASSQAPHDAHHRAPRYLRIRIGHTPSWMHVIDNAVFQIIERGSEGNSTVRELTRSMRDQAAQEALSGWARRSVRQFAHRAGGAEEYVFMLLRHAALHSGMPIEEHQDLRFDVLEKLLDRLGMIEFIVMPKPEFLLDVSEHGNASSNPHRSNESRLLALGTARVLCIAVFSELISRRVVTDRHAVQRRSPGAHPRLYDPVYEGV